MDYYDKRTICDKFNIRGGKNNSIDVFLLNITSLSFYFNPDLLPEWYLSTLILFYAISPLFKYLLEKGGWSLLILISLAIIMEEEFIGAEKWQYENALGRIPLYLLGMQCALTNKEDLSYKITVPLFLLSIAFFFQKHHYLFSACAIPLAIQIANVFIDKYKLSKNKLLNCIGSHTLEVYVGNTIAAVIAEHIFCPEMHVITKVTIDIMMTTGLSLLLWKLNLRLQKLS